MNEKANRSVKLKVICGGEQHEVVVAANGQVGLPGHPELEAEMVLVGLGGERPACLQVIDALKEGRRLPGAWELTQAIADANTKRQTRRNGRLSAMVDPLTQRPMWDRHKDLIVSRVLESLKACAYKQAPGGWEGSKHYLTAKVGANCTISGGTEKVWNGRASRIDVEVPRKWIKVYKRGLAVIDGCFVLAIVRESPDLIVLAGRQVGGYNVRPEMARVKGGKLQWLGR